MDKPQSLTEVWVVVTSDGEDTNVTGAFARQPSNPELKTLLCEEYGLVTRKAIKIGKAGAVGEYVSMWCLAGGHEFKLECYPVSVLP